MKIIFSLTLVLEARFLYVGYYCIIVILTYLVQDPDPE